MSTTAKVLTTGIVVAVLAGIGGAITAAVRRAR
jgi:hypothetical protein